MYLYLVRRYKIFVSVANLPTTHLVPGVAVASAAAGCAGLVAVGPHDRVLGGEVSRAASVRVPHGGERDHVGVLGTDDGVQGSSSVRSLGTVDIGYDSQPI